MLQPATVDLYLFWLSIDTDNCYLNIFFRERERERERESDMNCALRLVFKDFDRHRAVNEPKIISKDY